MPSIFPWTSEEGETAKNRNERALKQDFTKSLFDMSCKKELEKSFTEHVDCTEEVIETLIATPLFEDEFTVTNSMTQTDETPMFSIERFSSNNELIHFYTGLESHAQFMFVLNTLGSATYCLKYIYFQITGISVENQLFMTLIKLRRYSTNFELSTFFSVSEYCVKNIVYTWIIFMSKQWSQYMAKSESSEIFYAV